MSVLDDAPQPEPRMPGRRPDASVTTVGIVLFDGCDVIDVAGPYEVLLTANRLVQRRGGRAPFAVDTFTVDGGPVTGYGGLGLVPSGGALADAGPLGVLVVPGLIDVPGIATMDAELAAITTAAGGCDILASVCTGAFLLEAAGLLGDAPVTTHAEDAGALADRRGGGVRDDVRWVDSGRVVTAGGMTSGIAMTLHLVERLVDHALALATAQQMDYVWTEDRSVAEPGG